MRSDLTTAIQRLANAARTTSRGWMPVQEDVLEQIETKLASGEYRDSRSELIEDIKTDATLFISTLRQLGVNHPAAAGSVADDGFAIFSIEGRRFSPSELLYTSPLDNMREMVSETRRLSARHSYSSITDYQAAQLEELIVSTITSQTLACSLGIDPDLAYTCALLRQLGPSLAAWNYPDEFQQAFFMQNGKELDSRLAKLLGFSPRALGKLMVREWSLATDITEAISIDATRSHIGEDWQIFADEQLSQQLGKICEIGEALGKIVHIQYHPTAKYDWEAVQRAFDSLIGVAGIELVIQQARARILKCAPHNVTLPIPPILKALKKRLTAIEDQYQLVKRNTWLRFLPTEARVRVEHFYQYTSPTAVLDGTFLNFINDVLPHAGFSNGAVYLPDDNEQRLIPEFSFGTTDETELTPIVLDSTLARFDPVASAYSLKSLSHQINRDPNGNGTLRIAGAVSHVDPIVVLALETRDDFAERFGPDPIPIFRALMQFFSDCLDRVDN